MLNSHFVKRYVSCALVSLAASSFLASVTDASQVGRCEDLFESGGATKPVLRLTESTPIEVAANEIIRRAEASIDNPALGLSFRGFVASGPKPTPALEKLLARRGLFWWGVRFIPVASVEAAKARSLLETDHFMQANFVVVKGLSEADLQRLIETGGPKAYREILEKGEPIYVENVYEMDTKTGLVLMNPETKQPVNLIDQKVRSIDRDVIEMATDANEMDWILTVKKTGPYLVQSGWVLPHGRGVIEYSNVFNSPDAQGRTVISTSYKNLLYSARKLARDGYTFTFNKDFEGALNLTRDQERRDETDGTWSSENSRYKDPDVYNGALANHKAGKGVSVEIWNKEGDLIGGVLAFREGPVFKIDSVFYDNKRFGNGSIDLAKIAGVMLVQRLAEAGIPLLDMEMLSNYSKSLRGHVIPTRAFFEKIDALNPKAQVDLTTPWIPPTAEAFGANVAK